MGGGSINEKILFSCFRAFGTFDSFLMIYVKGLGKMTQVLPYFVFNTMSLKCIIFYYAGNVKSCAHNNCFSKI